MQIENIICYPDSRKVIFFTILGVYMKSLLKVLGLAALFSGSLLQGYAIVYDKDSPVAYVDVYLYKVKSEQQANEKHANYARLLKLPETVIETLEKGRGVSGTIAPKLGSEAAAVQKGVYQVVDVSKTGLKMFEAQKNEALGRAFRGKDHAFHSDVWRGNRGRDAEWKTDNDMYAIVTMPNNLAPLNEPVFIGAHDVAGFTLVPTGNAQDPYKAVFGGITGKYRGIASQYIRSEDDKRDKKKAKELAKISGERAFEGK